MPPGLTAVLLSLAFAGILSARGVVPYKTEFRTPWRRAAAFALWVVVLAFVVFLPVSSTGADGPPRLDEGSFALLFVGHAALCLFLLLWWALRGDIALSRFLYLEGHPALLARRLMIGVAAGLSGWALTLTVTAIVASIWFQGTRSLPEVDVPEVVLWMVELPAIQKSALILVAMTVEEAFFRAFLQPRLGLLLSSVCFGLSHFSYGLPFLVVGVFVVSLFLGWLFQRTQHLLPSIVAHGVFDAVQLFLVLPWAAKHAAYFS
ncbi:hypothetical protein HRbin30_01628 [bacterium HR30]|nr:hypothetical protein HRbin30_01628 [bacterium HR30]